MMHAASEVITRNMTDLWHTCISFFNPSFTTRCTCDIFKNPCTFFDGGKKSPCCFAGFICAMYGLALFCCFVSDQIFLGGVSSYQAMNHGLGVRINILILLEHQPQLCIYHSRSVILGRPGSCPTQHTCPWWARSPGWLQR